MSKIAKMRTFAFLILAAWGAAMAAPGYAQESPEKLATDVANDLTNHRLAAVVARFTPELAQGLPLPTLEKVWNGVLQQAGPVRELSPAHVVQVTPRGVALVIVPIRLERVARRGPLRARQRVQPGWPGLFGSRRPRRADRGGRNHRA